MTDYTIKSFLPIYRDDRMIETFLKLPNSIVTIRLIWKILFFLVTFIILITAIIGITTYFYEKHKLEQRFNEIQQTYMDIIRTALWIDDKDTLKVVLMGICRFPGIEYADIHTNNSTMYKMGKVDRHDEITRSFPIVHTYNGTLYTLGELNIKGSIDYVRGKIVKAVLIIATTQAVTIGIACIVLFILMYRQVIIRLLDITVYASSLSFESLETPLVFNKETGHPDELDNLANTINQMRENLYKAFSHQKTVEHQLSEHRQRLEEIVEQRTSLLKATNEELQSEIKERMEMEREREKLIQDLRHALSEVKKLSGMLPICSHCKKIRDDKGYWSQVESYIQRHSEAEFSHGICPECAKKYYPEFFHGSSDEL